MRTRILALLLFSTAALFVPHPLDAEPRQLSDYHWTGVERIVAIGDLHGDYDNYLAALRAAGLIDKRDRWSGGKAHLVQTGDIPDRGPDTAKIIEHIDRLAHDAEREGGRVHPLIGNHEAMNVYGDLRYVAPGEFEAFVTRNSDELRDRYFALVLQNLEQRDPDAFAALPDDFREQWNATHPLGWVEHRQAWDPRWNPDGKYAQRTLDQKVAVQINDLVFLHGGISGFYCRNSLESLTDMVVSRLRSYDPADAGPLEDEFGPLWYRGLSGHAPGASPETVQAILEHHGANHIVVGHTPTSGVIWPRYDGRVIQIDTGIGEAYGGHVAYLEVTGEGLFAGYPGGRIPLPQNDEERIAYLEKVIALQPGNAQLQRRLDELQAPPAEATAHTGQDASSTEATDESPPAGDPMASVVEAPPTEPAVPTCGMRE